MSEPPELVYLALGDSYTIGTGATHETRNFPSLLARRLESETGRTVRVVNPAVNGFTTIDLLAKEIGFITRLNPQLVSVLIGVNDIVQGRTSEQYRESLAEIYDAIASLEVSPGRAAAISIPDWTVTPAAAGFGSPVELKRRTDEFNAIARSEADKRAFTWVDIGPASRQRLNEPGWIAGDDLHPGDAQYAAWADEIWRRVGAVWSKA